MTAVNRAYSMLGIPNTSTVKYYSVDLLLIKKGLKFLQMEFFSSLWQLGQKRTDLDGFMKYFIEKKNSVIFLLFGSQWLFLICFFAGCHASKYERALLKKLFHSNYDKNERPVVNDSDAVVVVFGLTLNQIVDVVRYSEQLYIHVFIFVSAYNKVSRALWLDLPFSTFSCSCTVVCPNP